MEVPIEIDLTSDYDEESLPSCVNEEPPQSANEEPPQSANTEPPPPSSSKPRMQSARKGTGGRAPRLDDGDCAKMAKIQRTYEQLSFSKPGKQFADLGLERNARRCAEKKKATTSKRKPYYDSKGQFIHPEFEEPIKMCDCLSQECPGCFTACRKCNSKMCGPICQNNRNIIPIQMSVNGLGGLIVNNPLINEFGKRRKQKATAAEDEMDDEAEYSQPSTESDNSDDPDFL